MKLVTPKGCRPLGDHSLRRLSLRGVRPYGGSGHTLLLISYLRSIGEREEAERPAFVDSHESKWEEKKA